MIRSCETRKTLGDVEHLVMNYIWEHGPVNAEQVRESLLKRHPMKESTVYEIGGQEKLSYLDLMKRYGEIAGLRRVYINVPFLTPWLSSLWLNLVTPLFAKVGRKLIDSIRVASVVTDDRALRDFSVRPMDVSEAIRLAQEEEDREFGWSQERQATASHTLAGGAPITRSTSLTWDSAKCRPTRQRLEPGSSQWQVTYDLAYDTFGTLASSAVSGAGVSARVTTLDWGSRGQLPVAIGNALSQSTQLSWDLASGLPLAMTDPNSLTVSWSYDAFGELVQESQPDGTRTTWSRAACTAGCGSRATLRLTQQDRDSAGVERVTAHADIDQHGRAYRLLIRQPGGGTSVMAADADTDGRILREYLPFWEGGLPPGYWQFAYDPLGRLTEAALHSATGSVERSQALRHDGFTVTRTDALGHATAGTRTAWGRLAEVIDAAGNSTHFEYDAFGRLSGVRDALNNQVAAYIIFIF